MKSLTDTINENLEVKDLKIPETELIAEYDEVEGCDNKRKKELATKYGTSAKIADIRNAILVQMRFVRSNKTSFTDTDVRMFYRLGMPEMYKKAVELFKKESRKFLEFYKDYCWKDVVKHKLDKKLDVVKFRDWNYSISYADKSTITRYLNIEQYLRESEPEAVSSKKEKENFLNMIFAKLIEQSKEFKEEFISDAKAYAARIYDSAPKNRDKFKARYDEIFANQQKRREELRKEHKIAWNDYEYNELSKAAEKAFSEYRKYEGLLKAYTKSEYISKVEKEAEETFTDNMKALAERINDKGINVPDMNISEITDDPKYFALLVTDGETNLYARSIRAAEFSDKMRPHFRFIITSRK